MIHWGLKTRNNRSVQETEQYLYNLALIHRNVQLSWARSHNSRCHISTCSGIKHKKNYINTVQFHCFVSWDLDVSSRTTGFNLVLSEYVFCIHFFDYPFNTLILTALVFIYVGADSLAGSTLRYSAIVLWASRVQLATWGPFPIPALYLSLPLHVSSDLS